MGGRGSASKLSTKITMPPLTGTERQAKWAEDIRQQVLDGARYVYDNTDDNKYSSFEESPTGYTAIFAAENMTDSKFWINTIGYSVSDWYRWSDDMKKKTVGDLRGYINGMGRKFGDYGTSDLQTQFNIQHDKYQDKMVETRHREFEKRKGKPFGMSISDWEKKNGRKWVPPT